MPATVRALQQRCGMVRRQEGTGPTVYSLRRHAQRARQFRFPAEPVRLSAKMRDCGAYENSVCWLHGLER